MSPAGHPRTDDNGYDDNNGYEHNDYDVVIVGARYLRATLGALLARRGVRVAVLDRATAIRSTLSSNILQADSLAFLDRLGVMEALRAAGVNPMSHVDMRLEEFRCETAFPQAPGDVGGAACIRREVLDPVLVDAARTLGTDVRLGTRVTGLVRDNGGRVAGVRTVSGGSETIVAGLVVGADGRTSKVAEAAGARMYHVNPGERSYYWTYFEGAEPR
ncbi:hypothetical protein SALBM135S_08619 [Streptomyces alboniger]